MKATMKPTTPTIAFTPGVSVASVVSAPVSGPVTPANVTKSRAKLGLTAHSKMATATATAPSAAAGRRAPLAERLNAHMGLSNVMRLNWLARETSLEIGASPLHDGVPALIQRHLERSVAQVVKINTWIDRGFADFLKMRVGFNPHQDRFPACQRSPHPYRLAQWHHHRGLLCTP